jgi:hypothetical protein
VPYLLLFTLAFAAVFMPSRRAKADPQVAVRGVLDIGVRKFDDAAGEQQKQVIAGVGLRGDAMYGWPRPKSFRIGPAFELRTMSLDSLEAAAGAGILIPMPGDLPIGLTGLLGGVVRKGDELKDGLVAIGTATWGVRSYNYQHWYGYALNLFFSGRKQLNDEVIEFTGGIEVDIVFTTIIPGAAIWNFIKSGDPYEE